MEDLFVKQFRSQFNLICGLVLLLGAAIQGKTDLGDAPDSTNYLNRSMTAYAAGHTGLPYSIPGNFPTVYDDGSGTGPYGPVHLNSELVAYLGTTITRELEADTGYDEDGQNNLKVELAGSAANHDNGDDANLLIQP